MSKTVKNPCPSYDPVYSEYGGPCWTCQGVPEQCPLYWTENNVCLECGGDEAYIPKYYKDEFVGYVHGPISYG